MSDYNPNRLKELAKQKNILDVAQSLGLELKREGRNYAWVEHPSFKINPDKNYFSWFSRGNELLGADVIKMVEVINNVSFKEALQFLLDAEVGTFDYSNVPKKEPFVYRVKEVNTFDYARKYLHEERQLSNDTIDFFLSKGVMVQAIHKDYKTGKTEPMIVFKHLDVEGKIIGGARQGIWYNKAIHPDNGRLKRTLPNNTSGSGVVVDIGEKGAFKQSTPENPFKVYAFEAPIDMMSYYELHKDRLTNCRLVAMNGLNKGVISRATVEALAGSSEAVKNISEKIKLQDWLQKIDDLSVKSGKEFDRLKIILAVDNEEPKFNPKTGRVEAPGKDFVQSFGLKTIPVIPHLPKIHEGQKKNDWNDELKYQKEKQIEFEHNKQSTIETILSTVKNSVEMSQIEI